MAITNHYVSETTPGAEFDLIVLGRATRHRAELQLSDQRHKYRLLGERYREVVYDPGTGKEKRPEALTHEDRSEIERMTIEGKLLDDEISMVFAKTLLSSFKLPDEYKRIRTKDDLFESGPEPFVKEIETKAKDMWKLPEQEIKNSESPSSSQQAEDGKTDDTVATPASSSDSTEPVTAV